jgi:DedD protein
LADNPDATLLRRRARRRLIGAVALVVLVVVLLPIVLDQQPRSVTQVLTVQIPSQDAGPFNTRVLPPLPSPPEAKRKDESARQPEKAENTAQAGSQPGAQRKESAKPSERPKMDAGEAGPAQSGAKEEAFMVPLGAFANSDNAKQVQDKVASAGVKTYTERVRLPQGEQTRVRAGPFPSREAAENARLRLKALGLDVGQVAQR